MSVDLAKIRQEFPLLETKTYLNSCSYGVLATRVEAAFEKYLESRRTRGSDWEAWVGELENLRGCLSRLLCCPPEDVSISTSLSDSLNALASSLDFSQARDTIVTTDFDFPTTSQIWLAQERRGACVVRARADDTGVTIPLAAFDTLIDDRTKIVSLPWICYRNGVKLDIEPIIRLARERGALVFVDAYQAVGSLPLAAPELGADFVAGGCLKYLLGTAGIGFMYVRNSVQSPLIPVATGWFAQANIDAMDIHRNEPSPLARRFESGTPNVSATYACAAGIELVLDVGLEAIRERAVRLTGLIASGVKSRGWKLVTPASPDRHGSLIAIAATDAPALVRALAEDDIVVSDRDNNLRVSPHFYNDDEDIERLFAALERNARLLAV